MTTRRFGYTWTQHDKGWRVDLEVSASLGPDVLEDIHFEIEEFTLILGGTTQSIEPNEMKEAFKIALKGEIEKDYDSNEDFQRNLLEEFAYQNS